MRLTRIITTINMSKEREQKSNKREQIKPRAEDIERRAVISMLRIWIKKYPNEYKKVYQELQMFTENRT